MINELKNKTRQVKETRLLKQDEVYNGALEDILLGTDYVAFLLTDINNIVENAGYVYLAKYLNISWYIKKFYKISFVWYLTQ